MNKCDICGSTKNIIAGRWYFYCPKHKQNDIDKTFEMEIEPDLKSGNMDYILNDTELQDLII